MRLKPSERDIVLHIVIRDYEWPIYLGAALILFIAWAGVCVADYYMSGGL